MGNWLSDFFEETGEFLSENAGTILTIGGTAMGIPPETMAIAKTVLGAMGKKNISAADKTNALIQSGIDAQTAYQLAALDEVKSSGQRSTAIATADKQMAYDINRGQFASNQQNIQPYQMASLSALQALPQLQQLLGVNAYNLPTSISQYTPPQVDFADTYAKTQERLFPTDDAATTPPPTSNPSGVGEVGSGLRASMRPENEAGVAPAGATGGTTTQTLTPYTGDAYDLNNSPLYKWQKQQMEEKLRNQLAASGLSGGTYAQRELARNEQSLAAQERERVVGNLQSLTSLGMQGANLGQSSFSLPQSSDLLNAGSSQAGQIVDIYGNLGNIAGVGATQLAQNNAAAANAKNSGTSVWQDLYELGSSQDWWSGKSKSSSGSSTPYTTSLGYTLPGEFQLNNKTRY
jgi:hypothetical protein